MAKQTFTTGQVLTAAQMTSLQQTAMLGGAANAKVASYVLVAADAGDAITMSNASPTTITVNTGLFAAGDTVTIINLGAGATTITAGTATVTTSGSLVLATNQGGVLRFTSASAAIFFQFATPASGDIEGVTAGTGISGGGTSGTVTITNSMATAIDAKGDLIVGTGADTFGRLIAGANGTTLVADSAEATGLKWAAPAGGGGMTQIGTTTTLSGTTTTISSLGSYKHLCILINGVTTAGSGYTNLSVAPNGNTTLADIASVARNTANGQYAGPILFNSGWNGQPNTPEYGTVLWIYNYGSTSMHKPFSFSGFHLTSFMSGDPVPYNGGGVWRSNSAITSLDFNIAGGNSANGGTVIVYGVS